jgi:hypothetical protein
VTRTPNPYRSLDDQRYDAVVNGLKSTFSSGNGGCLSFTVAGGLIGFQYDKLPPPSASPAPASMTLCASWRHWASGKSAVGAVTGSSRIRTCPSSSIFRSSAGRPSATR